MRVFDRVDRKGVEDRELQLSLFSIAINVVLAAGVALLMYPTVSAHPIIFSARTSRIFFFGFCGLCVLLVSYLFDRQIVVRRLRREIVQNQLRFAQMQEQAGRDLLGSMSGLDHFQDRLMMEFKRSVQTEEPLSVLVIRVSPASALAEDRELTAAYGDAAKAITRKLRRQDSLFLFMPGAFGILLPGSKVMDARQTSDRLMEGLSDAAGAVGRFTSEIKIFNYPENIESAHAMELAVRGLLPRDLVSEPMVADALSGSGRHKG
jgi:GGDEF domain-containing protein